MSPEGTRSLAAGALRAAARGLPGPPAPRLEVLDGPLAGRWLPLGEEETVGRGAGASLALPDPQASRRHLRLRLLAGVVTAEDLGSKNGSRVNRWRLRRARRLHPGDELTVGTTRLRLENPQRPPGPRAPRRPRLPSPPAPALWGAGLALLAAAAALLLRS